MRILLAANQLPGTVPGGVGLFTLHLAQELATRGHQITLLAGCEQRVSGPPQFEHLAQPTPNLTILQLRRSRGQHLPLLSSLVDPAAERRLSELIVQVNPEVLHVHHTINLSANICAMGIKHGAGVVATIHDFWPICQRIVLRRPDGTNCAGPLGGLRCSACLPHAAPGDSAGRWFVRSMRVASRLLPYALRTQLVQGAYASAHILTCPSKHAIRQLYREGFDKKGITYVDHGVLPVAPEIAMIERPRTPFGFGYLGTLAAHKGLHLLLDALQHLPPEGWRLTIHGGPLQDPSLRQRLTATRGVLPVDYAGPYTPEALPGLLAKLDAVIIPSLWPETGPLVWMEATSTGLPVIGTRMGALESRIHHLQDGLLIPPGDPRALARAMTQLMEYYPSFRRQALDRPVRAIKDVVPEMESIYKSAMHAARVLS